MKKFENPMMEIAFFEAENVITASGETPDVQITAEEAATMTLKSLNVRDIKYVNWTF